MLFILLTSNIIIQGITTMYKRIICFFLVVVLTISMFSFAASAEDHQHTFGEVENTIDLSGATMPNGDSLPLGLSITKSPCSTPGVDCDQVRYSWDFFGRKGSFVDDKNLPVAQVILHWYKWNEEFYGKNVGFDKLDSTNAGANIPAAGGRNPKGYSVDGKAYVDSNGKSLLWAEPFGLTGSFGWSTEGSFSKDAPGNLHAGASGSGASFASLGGDASSANRAAPVYYFTAPVSGLYYIGVDGSPYDLGSFNSFYNNTWNRTDYEFTYTDTFHRSISLNKGESAYLTFNYHVTYCSGNAYKYYLNNIPIFIEPLGDSGVTNQNNITINNNTWNGNIYVDNSNNLTYIYPQYTTVNEKNETVTNISNTPIIYNNETYQYYTYDQTTKNYYYITYPNQPTPPPTATPSPSPAPTETPSPSLSPAPVEPILPANRFRIIPNMTGNNFTDSHGTWSAFGSSQYNSSYTYFRAFTVDTSYWWTSSQEKKSGSYDREMPCWLAIEIPDPENYYIDGYVLKGAGSGIYYDDWQFQYSDDGSAWTDLDFVSDGGLKDQKEHDFNVAVHKAHKYYRWYFTKAPVSWPGLGTANLYGYNAKDVVVPTPAPSPTPSPTDPPSPSPTPAPTDKPGGSISTPETGKPGGSSGSSWWDKLLSKIGDAIIDGLLGAVSAVLKLIFKLLSTILSWIIWAVSRVFDLLPFLPPGLGGLLVGGVVVCFVIGIIKFIRG